MHKRQNKPVFILICLLLFSTGALASFCACSSYQQPDHSSHLHHCKLKLKSNYQFNLAIENHLENLQLDGIPASVDKHHPVNIAPQQFSKTYSYTQVIRIDRPPQS